MEWCTLVVFIKSIDIGLMIDQKLDALMMACD